MIIYIAGPMSGLPEYNYPAFTAAARSLRDLGFDVRSPHEIDSGGIARAWDWYMRRTLLMMLECDEILLLPGWQNSRGALLEKYVAQTLGMRVTEFDCLPTQCNWGKPWPNRERLEESVRGGERELAESGGKTLTEIQLAAAVAEIQELHQSHRPRHLDLCVECDKGWPCPTVAILERHGP